MKSNSEAAVAVLKLFVDAGLSSDHMNKLFLGNRLEKVVLVSEEQP